MAPLAPTSRAPYVAQTLKSEGGIATTRVKNDVAWPILMTLKGEIDSFEQRVAEGVFQPLGPTITQTYVTKNGHASDVGENPDTAACGSSALAAMLNRFGKFATTEGIDQHLRVTKNLGGSLYASAEYLRTRGLQAQLYNGGSWEDLRTGIEHGFGVIVSITHQASAHTLVVTGMYRDDKGKEFIQVQDWLGVAVPMTLSREQFEEGWARTSLGGLDGIKTGIRYPYTIVGAAGSTLPVGGSLVGEIGAVSSHVMLDGFHAFASGVSYIGEGEITGGAARITGGLVELLPQLPTALVQTTGASIEWCGDRLIAVMAKAKSVPEIIGAALLGFVAGPLKALGFLLRELGQLCGMLVGLFSRLFAFPLLKLADWLHSDNDACNQLSHCDPEGNDREKRNWADLVASPPSAKAELIDAMLRGHVGERERRMILRALLAAEGERAQVIALVGEKRLRAATST